MTVLLPAHAQTWKKFFKAAKTKVTISEQVAQSPAYQAALAHAQAAQRLNTSALQTAVKRTVIVSPHTPPRVWGPATMWRNNGS